MKVFLSHIFCNKKLVVVTMLNFLFEVREVHEVRVYCSSVDSVSIFIAFAIFDGELPLAKMSSLRKKHGTRMFAADK